MTSVILSFTKFLKLVNELKWKLFCDVLKYSFIKKKLHRNNLRYPLTMGDLHYEKCLCQYNYYTYQKK